jgi:IS30 family transposase
VSHLLILDAADEPEWFLCKPHGNEERTSNYAPMLAEFNLPFGRLCCRKGTDLSVHSAADLDWVAAELNDRPRKRLAFDKPIEAIEKLLLQ